MARARILLGGDHRGRRARRLDGREDIPRQQNNGYRISEITIIFGKRLIISHVKSLKLVFYRFGRVRWRQWCFVVTAGYYVVHTRAVRRKTLAHFYRTHPYKQIQYCDTAAVNRLR